MISQYYPQSVLDIVEFDVLKRGVYEVLETQLLSSIELIAQNLMCKTMTSDAIGAISNIVFGDASIRDPEVFINKLNAPKLYTESDFIRDLANDELAVESITDTRGMFPLKQTDKFRLMFEHAIFMFDDLHPKESSKLIRRWFEGNNISLTSELPKSTHMLNAPMIWVVNVNKGIHVFDQMYDTSGTLDDYSNLDNLTENYSDTMMFSGYRKSGIIDVVGELYSWSALATLSQAASHLPINMKVMYFGWSSAILGDWPSEGNQNEYNRNAVCHGASATLILYGECHD